VSYHANLDLRIQEAVGTVTAFAGACIDPGFLIFGFAHVARYIA
jgi:hypothetical protein